MDVMVDSLDGPINWVGWSLRGPPVLARLMESQIWHCLAGSVVCSSERDSGLCSPFCLRENCPTALSLVLDTSVSPSMPLGPLSCYMVLELREGESESVHVWVLQGDLLGTLEVSSMTQSPLVFAAGSYRDLSSWHWNPGLVVPSVGLGLLAPEISLPKFLSTTRGCGTSPFSVFASTTSLDGCGFF